MSQRMNYNAASPAGMKAFGAVYGYVRQSPRKYIHSRRSCCAGRHSKEPAMG
jgi:hypothetical protein